MNIKQSALKGIGWMGTLKVSTRAISYLRIAVLARLLTPEQFGVYGIATLVLSLLEILTETGINVFFIQGEGKIKNYISTAWIVSIGRGVLMTLIILSGAQTISSFFGNQLVVPVLLVGSLVPFLRGFINPAIVKLRKNLYFKQEFFYRFSIFAVESLTAIFLAFYTADATSLAWGLVVGAVLELFISFAFIKPWPELCFEYKKFKRIVNRGKFVTASWLGDYLFRNTDDAVVGKLFSADTLGIYQVGYKFSSLPVTELTDVFNRVTFPLYAKIKDRVELERIFKRTLTATAVLALILAGFLYLFAEPIVRVFLGSLWEGVVPIIKTLVIFGVIRALTTSFNSLFLALKKQEYVTVIGSVQLLSLIAYMLPLIYLYQFMGVVYAVILSSLTAVPFCIYYYRRLKATWN